MASRVANLTIAGAILIAVAMMVAVTLDYQAGRSGTGRLIASYVVLGVVAALLIASFRLRPSRKGNLALALASSVLTVYAIEAALVLLSPVTTAQMAACLRTGEPFKCIEATSSGTPFDTRTKIEVVRDLEEDGVDAWPSILHSPLVARYSDRERGIMPMGGISTVATVHCNEAGEWVVYSSDEHGFNNPGGLYHAPLDVAVVGDSFTRGYCVEPELNVAGLIRRIHPRTLNLGVDDSGPLITLATIKEYVAPLEPRVVTWLYFEGNDLYDLDREKGSARLLRYLEPGYDQGLLSVQEEVDRELREYVRAMAPPSPGPTSAARTPGRERPLYRFLALAQLRGKITLLTRPRKQATYPYDRDLFRRVLVEARDTTMSWGGTLYFVYMTSFQRLSGSDNVEPHRDEVLRTIRELEIPIIDLHEVFRSHDDPLSFFPYRLPGHYNERGYRAVADAVLPVLEPASPQPRDPGAVE
jgi:hypothetical protein